MLGQHVAHVKRKRGMAEYAFDGRNGRSKRVVPRIMVIIRPGMQVTVFRDIFCFVEHGRGYGYLVTRNPKIPWGLKERDRVLGRKERGVI